jgi:uncharacterized membrane protein
VFHLIARVDLGLLWLNLLLLLSVGFMPYPTVLLANAMITGQGQSTATICYGATLVAGGVLFNATWLHASWHGRLLQADAPPEIVRAMGRRFLRGPLVCALITPVALVQVGLTLLGYVVLLTYYGVAAVRESVDGVNLRHDRHRREHTKHTERTGHREPIERTDSTPQPESTES